MKSASPATTPGLLLHGLLPADAATGTRSRQCQSSNSTGALGVFQSFRHVLESGTRFALQPGLIRLRGHCVGEQKVMVKRDPSHMLRLPNKCETVPCQYNTPDNDLQNSRSARVRLAPISPDKHIPAIAAADFDEDLSEIAYARPVDIHLRFVLKSEHSADFALMERLKAMFLGLDDALCSRLKEENIQENPAPLPIEVKEISDQEYRADLRLGLGFEY
ncbi:hypothetical protein AAF712_007151 [Marasmius tenuissimus]|uniref:Uncharacterized protein n=1 Tax=Marasmius tenuissimus TaxID=585030 RepID=A0ABR2ZWW1_9AGAR